MAQSSLTVPSSRVTGVRSSRWCAARIPVSHCRVSPRSTARRKASDSTWIRVSVSSAMSSIDDAHPEAALRRGDQQALLGQAGERLPDDGLAYPESVGELDHLRFFPDAGRR